MLFNKEEITTHDQFSRGPILTLEQLAPHLRCRCALTVGEAKTGMGKKTDELRVKAQAFGIS